eukprot:1902962-Prymnesium_polylepis.1
MAHARMCCAWRSIQWRATHRAAPHRGLLSSCSRGHTWGVNVLSAAALPHTQRRGAPPLSARASPLPLASRLEPTQTGHRRVTRSAADDDG